MAFDGTSKRDACFKPVPYNGRCKPMGLNGALLRKLLVMLLETGLPVPQSN